jgi:hypothetical protein
VDSLYLSDYDDFKDLLVKKYGAQTEEKVRWLNDLFKDDRSHWGMALSMGHLILLNRWEPPDTIISLLIVGDNLEVKCGILYESRALKPLADKAKETKELEAF